MLLQKRREGDYWTLPGGVLEPGESLEEAARRELLEDTGLIVEGLAFLTVCSGPGFERTYPNGDRIHNFVAVYEATGTRGEPRPDGDECTELCFFAFDALPEMPAATRMLARALAARRRGASG